MKGISVALFPTIPRYYTALAEWMNCMVFVVLFYRQRRFKGISLVGIAACGLVVLAVELMLTEALPALLWPVGMALAAAIMLLLLLGCLDVTPIQGGYLLATAFMWSEFAASLSWQIYYFYASLITGMLHGLTGLGLVLVVYTAQFFAVLHLYRYFCPEGHCLQVSRRDMLTAVTISLSFFVVSNLSFIFPDTPFTSKYATDIFYIRTLIDAGAVAILLAFLLQKQELNARYELEAIQSVLQTQYSQYLQSKDSMELINRKYHDMKHQITALRAEADPGKRMEWLDAMENDIAVYDTVYQTGNAALDTVLSSKSMTCLQKHIDFTVVADGTLLKFMEVMDICTIFGNALDNAIESVIGVTDGQRLIHMSVSREKGFLLIRVENNFAGERTFEGGIPKSTKGDDAYHGFGVKSIRYSAGRYGGTMTIRAENHWFDLKILIPLTAP